MASHSAGVHVEDTCDVGRPHPRLTKSLYASRLHHPTKDTVLVEFKRTEFPRFDLELETPDVLRVRDAPTVSVLADSIRECLVNDVVGNPVFVLDADSETVGVSVSRSGAQQGELRVTELSAPDTVNRESELVVSYELENIGDLGTMENIVFSLNSQQIDFKQISVAPGQTVSDEFTYQVTSNAPSSLVAEISSHNDAQTTSIDVLDMSLLNVELNPGSSGSAPIPTFDDTGIVVEGDRSQWGGSTWSTAGNWMVYEYPEAPESITWEFDYRYDTFTNSNSFQDRGNRMLRVYNQDNNEIFRIWRTRNTIRFLEEPGDFRDIRSNNQALRSVVTGTTYTMRVEYNEHGNDEYRIYIDGVHQITVGDNRGGSYTNDAPGYLRFDGRDSGTRSDETTRLVIDYISDTFNQYEA